MQKIFSYHVLTVAAIILISITIVIVFGLLRKRQPKVLQGEVETTDYRISSKMPGRVKRLYVKEGDIVKKGDTLVILFVPEIEAKKAQAQAALEAANQMEKKTRNGTREEIVQSAYEMWQNARAGLNIATKTFERFSRLYDEGVIPAQRRDEVQARLEAATATERAAHEQYLMARNGVRIEDKETATSHVNQAKGAVNEVSAYQNETVMTAQADGRVAEVFPEEGELLGSGAPIMNINTNDAWFTFNITEDNLKDFQLGGQKEIFIPALDKKITARITLMKNVGNFVTWKATRSLDKYDFHTFEVQLHPLHPENGLHENMSAVIESL